METVNCKVPVQRPSRLSPCVGPLSIIVKNVLSERVSPPPQVVNELDPIGVAVHSVALFLLSRSVGRYRSECAYTGSSRAGSAKPADLARPARWGRGGDQRRGFVSYPSSGDVYARWHITEGRRVWRTAYGGWRRRSRDMWCRWCCLDSGPDLHNRSDLPWVAQTEPLVKMGLVVPSRALICSDQGRLGGGHGPVRGRRGLTNDLRGHTQHPGRTSIGLAQGGRVTHFPACQGRTRSPEASPSDEWTLCWLLSHPGCVAGARYQPQIAHEFDFGSGGTGH